MADGNEQDEGDELTPEEKAEKVQKELADGADRALNRWHEAAPEEVRVATIDSYVETGLVDHEKAGVDALEAQVVQYAFTSHIERNILAPLGLTMNTWSEHIDEAELPAFRRAAVEGDWELLRQHAQASAKLRFDLGI